MYTEKCLGRDSPNRKPFLGGDIYLLLLERFTVHICHFDNIKFVSCLLFWLDCVLHNGTKAGVLTKMEFWERSLHKIQDIGGCREEVARWDLLCEQHMFDFAGRMARAVLRLPEHHHSCGIHFRLYHAGLGRGGMGPTDSGSADVPADPLCKSLLGSGLLLQMATGFLTPNLAPSNPFPCKLSYVTRFLLAETSPGSSTSQPNREAESLAQDCTACNWKGNWNPVQSGSRACGLGSSNPAPQHAPSLSVWQPSPRLLHREAWAEGAVA